MTFFETLLHLREASVSGRHSVDVMFAGQQVKGSPFYIEVFDVSKIRVDNFYNGNVGEPAGFHGKFSSFTGRKELTYINFQTRIHTNMHLPSDVSI